MKAIQREATFKDYASLCFGLTLSLRKMTPLIFTGMKSLVRQPV
jgi:hypothetical protein